MTVSFSRMGDLDRQTAPEPMSLLRESIRRKYETYHVSNRDQFPDFDYNTNRANYEPLRKSFEQEFYEVRKIDRSSNFIHIPSTNTLALLFTDNSYVPNPKILNTCREYAIIQPGPLPKATKQPRFPVWIWWLVLVAAGVSLAIYLTTIQAETEKAAGRLMIHSPRPSQFVPRLTKVTGSAKNVESVWLVVHPAREGDKYYIQDVAAVHSDGSWSGDIIVGTSQDYLINVPFELRAFVNPKGSYDAYKKKSINTFDSWPEHYDLATEPVVVYRKARKRSETPMTASELSINSPQPSQVVSRILTVTGHVKDAADVWVVVHPTNEDKRYFLQNVVPVSADGSWKAGIILGTVEEIPTDRFFELRAFIKPKGAYETLLKQGEFITDSWPERYELATKPIVLIRKGNKKQQNPTDAKY